MNIDELCRDEFERVCVLRDARAHLIAFVVIHSTRLGPAFGGIRRWTYPSADDALEDALRLASAMTLKCAISSVPGGGGKTVIMQQPELDREAAYLAVGRCVAELGGQYFTGPDVGTTAEDLAVVARVTGNVALPTAMCGDLAEPTAIGVLAGVEAVARQLGHDSLDGVHVVVQGLGEVGYKLATKLAAAGARLTVADVRQTHAQELAESLGATLVESERAIEVECDVFAPCALGGVVDARTLPLLRARGIAGSANNQLADPALADELAARGIVYAPDFLVSSGALIQGAMFHLEGAPPPASRILAIGRTLDTVFATAAATGRSPDRVARELATERVASGKIADA